MNTPLTRTRDILLFLLLLFMLKVATDRSKNGAIKRALYSPIPHQHALEITDNDNDLQDEDQETAEPIVFEFNDQQSNFAKDTQASQELLQETVPLVTPSIDLTGHFETTEQQIKTLLALTPSTSKESAQLQSIEQRIVQLKENYRTISGSNPVIDAGIFPRKQEQIEKNLLRIIQLITRILHVHLDSQNPVHYETIEQGLQENDALLNELQNIEKKSENEGENEAD